MGHSETESGWRPDQQTLTDAMQELQDAKKLLLYGQPQSINANIAAGKISEALEKIKSVIFNYATSSDNRG